MHDVNAFPQVKPTWKHHRVIHSKYPTENLFDEDDETNFILGLMESETSDRVVNYLHYVDELDVRHGNGWGAVMASFCYPGNGRFSTSEKGAYYCADTVDAAIAEWAHHAAKLWREFGFTNDASAIVRCYTGTFKELLVDVRDFPEFHQHDPQYQYLATQQIAAQVKAAGGFGILYNSVRMPGSQCAALLRPPATSPVTQSAHYVAMFDGQRFTNFAQIGKFHSI